MPERFRRDSPLRYAPCLQRLANTVRKSKAQTRNKIMKLTKEQITEKREELCKVLVAMNRQKAKVE